MRGGSIHAHGDAHSGIPEVGIRSGRPAASDDADEAVFALDRGFETMGSENHHFGVASNGVRSGGAREGDFGRLIGHEVSIDRSQIFVEVIAAFSAIWPRRRRPSIASRTQDWRMA